MEKTGLRRMASNFRRRVRETLSDWRHRCGYSKPANWEESLIADELSFWENALMAGGKNWDPAEFQKRANLELPLQSELRELISAAPNSVVRILDVGSGPLTRIGNRWPGHEVQITAADPLANHYNALLKKLGIVQRVPVTFAHGEKLLDIFPPNYFDLAYASNSLDHSYDPLKAVEQMLAVVKPGAFAYLWHFSNVGIHECYNGLHQWNFDIIKGDFVMRSGKAVHSMTSHFGPAIQLECDRTWAFDAAVVIAKIKKISPPSV